MSILFVHVMCSFILVLMQSAAVVCLSKWSTVSRRLLVKCCCWLRQFKLFHVCKLYCEVPFIAAIWTSRKKNLKNVSWSLSDDKKLAVTNHIWFFIVKILTQPWGFIFFPIDTWSQNCPSILMFLKEWILSQSRLSTHSSVYPRLPLVRIEEQHQWYSLFRPAPLVRGWKMPRHVGKD